MNKSIQYFQQGHGQKKVLFLHGWLSDYKIYEPILPYFDTEKYTIICPDFRGYGKSKLITGKYTLDEISQDVINLLESLNWTKINIVGHSMAGQVIQKIALKRPGLINKGIAITPVPASGFTMDEDTRSFFQSSFDDDAALAQIFHTLTGNRNSDAFIKSLVKEARKTTTREAYLGYQMLGQKLILPMKLTN